MPPSVSSFCSAYGAARFVHAATEIAVQLPGEARIHRCGSAPARVIATASAKKAERVGGSTRLLRVTPYRDANAQKNLQISTLRLVIVVT